MVIGHKIPDTDSICSAIAFACYKRDVAGVAAVPYRAGNLNPQTSFVLEHFGVAAPELVTTPLSPLEVATRLCLAMPLHDFVERQYPTFKPHELVCDVQKEIGKSNEGGFSVVGDDRFLCGIVTRLSFLTPWKVRVALVDHNGLSQCVDGIEEREETGISSGERPATVGRVAESSTEWISSPSRFGVAASSRIPDFSGFHHHPDG